MSVTSNASSWRFLHIHEDAPWRAGARAKASAVQRGQYYALRMRIYLKWEPQLQDSPVLAAPVVRADYRPSQEQVSCWRLLRSFTCRRPLKSLRPQAAQQKRQTSADKVPRGDSGMR